MPKRPRSYELFETMKMWVRTTSSQLGGTHSPSPPRGTGSGIGVLVTALARADGADPDLNSFIVSDLVELDAAEAAPVIERLHREFAVALKAPAVKSFTSLAVFSEAAISR